MSGGPHDGGSEHKKPASPSFLIYLVLFALQIPEILVRILRDKSEFGLTSGFASTVLAVSSLGLLALIYFDMHDIDRLGKRDGDYPEWVGNFWEITLRILIIASLIFGNGELAPTLDQYVNAVRSYVCLPGSAPSTGFDPLRMFVGGSLAAFFFIAIWNTGALWHRSKNCRGRLKKAREQPSSDRPSRVAEDVVITFRIGVFLLLTSVCAFYWTIVAIKVASSDGPNLTMWSNLFLVTFAFSVVLAALLRVPRTRIFFAKIMDDFLEKAR